VRLALLIPLVAGWGCAAAAPGPLAWHDDLPSAMWDAGAANRPLLVVSIVGDLRKRC